MYRIVLSLLASAWLLQAQQGTEAVLIKSAKPYTALINEIQSRGGIVTRQFQYVDAIAASIPSSQLAAIASLLPEGAIAKDLAIPSPTPSGSALSKRGLSRIEDSLNIAPDSVEALDNAAIAGLAAANPDAYIVNNVVNGTAPLHAAGITGAGILVAVIDSGIRPNFPHISLDGSVVACEDFVGDALGCTNYANDGHGTFVAGMISASVVFTFSTASAIRNAVLAECPACFSNPPVNTRIPMVGTAPSSSIYALRVFGPSGGGPTSRIIAAIERVIELRTKFNNGDPAGRKVQVCNLSLGGSTLFPGSDLMDTAIDRLLDAGVVPVISAGNAGPSSITVGSPGTSRSAITVGAASLARNERILYRLLYGPTVGPLVRPFLGTQTAYFSSRGPNADGSVDPDVTANGFANFGQGFSTTTLGISIASGTSFSSPSVAGVAALLRQIFPLATARQIRNAIIGSANPSILTDGSTEIDRGAGYVDATAARDLLLTGKVPDTLPPPPVSVSSVKVNVERASALNVVDAYITRSVPPLKPGERYDILYRVAPNTSRVLIALTGVTPTLPPAQQNQLFGDDILLAVHTAKTSAIGEGDYKFLEFTKGGSFVVQDPETGILRVTVNGDWTNAGNISANVSIVSVIDPVPLFTSQGKISQGQVVLVPVQIPAGVSTAEFRFGWRQDWGSFPVSDLDMILIRPNGTVDFGGATLSNPEYVTVDHPAAGTWIVLLSGFQSWVKEDRYDFRASLDGVVVK